jgi:hypothetical protein
LFVCLFVSISLFSSSFCLGFAFPERDFGNWYVVSLGLFLLFYHSGRNGNIDVVSLLSALHSFAVLFSAGFCSLLCPCESRLCDVLDRCAR